MVVFPVNNYVTRKACTLLCGLHSPRGPFSNILLMLRYNAELSKNKQCVIMNGETGRYH